MERRRLLEALGAAGGTGLVGLGGCSFIDSRPSDGGQGGEGDDIEVVVSNGTDATALVAVRVEGRDGEVLFGHVYELGAGKTDEVTGDGEIEARPATVRAFTPDGTSATWEYTPETGLNCDGQDIGIRLLPDGIEHYYTC